MNEFIGKWKSFITEDKTPLRENFEVGDTAVFKGDQLKGEEMTVVGKRKMFAVKDNGRDLMAIQVELPDGSTSEYDETQLVKVRGGDRVRAGVRSAAEKLGMKPSHIDESLAEGYEIGDEVILRGNSTGDYVFTIVDSRKMFGSNLMAYTVKDKNTGDVMEYDETQLAAVPTIMMADEFDVEDEDDESTKRRRNHQAQSMDRDGYVDLDEELFSPNEMGAKAVEDESNSAAFQEGNLNENAVIDSHWVAYVQSLVNDIRINGVQEYPSMSDEDVLEDFEFYIQGKA